MDFSQPPQKTSLSEKTAKPQSKLEQITKYKYQANTNYSPRVISGNQGTKQPSLMHSCFGISKHNLTEEDFPNFSVPMQQWKQRSYQPPTIHEAPSPQSSSSLLTQVTNPRASSIIDIQLCSQPSSVKKPHIHAQPNFIIDTHIHAQHE